MSHLQPTNLDELIPLFSEKTVKDGLVLGPFTVEGRFAPISAADLGEVMAVMLADPHLSQHFKALTQAHRDGLLAGTNDVVAKIIGRRLETIGEFVRKKKEKKKRKKRPQSFI